MKRYYLADTIGDGTENDPFRPAVADLGVAWVGSIPFGPDDRPTLPWTLVLVAAKDHGRVRAAAGVDALPDFPLDGKMTAINAATRNALDAALARRGIPSSATGGDGYRDVIRSIGRQIDAGFDENNFDIADV